MSPYDWYIIKCILMYFLNNTFFVVGSRGVASFNYFIYSLVV